MPKAKIKILDDEILEPAAECLKVMAHPARLKIVDILMQGQFAVHEIAELADISPNQTCEHLRLLKGHGFLTSQRKSRTVYYNIASQRLVNLVNCIKKTCGK
jgi:ArsR family transcriptional regulator, zinc-responsive transcriptional repressor